jgi:hypothetical protein
MQTGIELITKERQEQIEKHGRTIDHDVKNNTEGQLIEGIMLLISNIGFKRQNIEMPKDVFEDLRPSDWRREICWKMLAKPEIEQLKIIGTFAAAEIDRLQNTK